MAKVVALGVYERSGCTRRQLKGGTALSKDI